MKAPTKLKIGVLGGTGRSGHKLVQQALDEGHEVVAVVRAAQNFHILHKNLKVIQDNIFSREVLKEEFQTVDVVMSVLGFPLGVQPITGYTAVTRCVCEVLREIRCKRFILLHSWHTHPEARSHPSWSTRRRKFLHIISPVLDNIYDAEEYLKEECEDIDWTVVSPPGLTLEPRTNLPIEVANGEYFILGVSRTVPRGDVAGYMLNIVNDIPTFRKIQAISTKFPEIIEPPPIIEKRPFKHIDP